MFERAPSLFANRCFNLAKETKLIYIHNIQTETLQSIFLNKLEVLGCKIHQVKEIPPSHSLGQKRVEGIVHHLVSVLEIRVGDQKKSLSCLQSDNNKV